ncbi:unnamed protein product [Candida verbasci]|uniref:Opaque-phase-specific protein OP4 n=1 Tax=Candida verbasci TaxID=1227364 RepID=A0A9W4TZ07_9ASCO|nr:unnamed protein product [Candida verbasci]
MKTSSILTAGTLFLASFSPFVYAAPVSEDIKITELTVRETESINKVISNLNHYTYNKKRNTLPALRTRAESDAVTGILELVKNTNLGPAVLTYIIDDPTLSQEASDVIVGAIQNGYINLDSLLKALNDSGLAVSVIQDLINDCQFYAQIFKLVGEFIGNLPAEIGSLLGLNAATVSNRINAVTSNTKKRDLSPRVELVVPVLNKRDNYTLTDLLSSLNDSGLANQVVEALVVDDQFYTWGASLIEQLFSSGAITFSSLLEAIIDSGLVPTIIENFLTVDTLRSVIVNALAAAFGNCQSVTPTTTLRTTTAGSPTPTIPTITATTAPSVSGAIPTSGNPSATVSIPTVTGSGTNCRRKRRSY